MSAGFQEEPRQPGDPAVTAHHDRYRDPAVVARYDRQRYTDLQGRLNNRMAWRALRRALRHARPGGRLLDMPCGTGRFSRQLVRAGFEVLAGDISQAMLEAAARVEPGMQCFQGDIFHLPFPDRTFAAAVCIRLFNLLDRPKRIDAVRELARVADVVIAGYYHKYTLKYAGRSLRHRLGLHKGNHPRLSRAGLREEIGEARLRVHEIISVCPFLSEEWLVVMSRGAE